MSVVLIFREIERRWRDDHPINVLAALMTRSKFSHVELAIGSSAGANGEMTNVLRIFNDNVGVELAQRTGTGPTMHYVQLGCSEENERRMLAFAREQKGKPFDMPAMVRSIIYPRKTHYKSYFCAELVAATLKEGRLLSATLNPGASTPQSLYEHFSKIGTATGNPYTLRQISASISQKSNVSRRIQDSLPPSLRALQSVRTRDDLQPLLGGRSKKRSAPKLGGRVELAIPPPTSHAAPPSAHARASRAEMAIRNAVRQYAAREEHVQLSRPHSQASRPQEEKDRCRSAPPAMSRGRI